MATDTPDLAWCARNLAGIPLSHVLGFVSGINVRLQKTMSRSDADREAAMAWFEPGTAQKVLNLLRGPRALLNAQANLVLAKLAIKHAEHLDGPAGDDGSATLCVRLS